MKAFLPIAIALLGLAGGGLVNYLADVLPHTRRLSRPTCQHCGHPQDWVRYLIWPRRCQNCDRSRQRRVWVVEAIYAGIALWLWYAPSEQLPVYVAFPLLLYFGVVVVIDLEHLVILHPVSLFGALLGLAIGAWLHGLPAALIGGAVGFALMLGLFFFGDFLARRIARRRGEELEEVALGFGDVNLAGVIGLLLGWPEIINGLFLAILIGGVVAAGYYLIMKFTGRYQSYTAIPYGPYLVLGATVALFFPDSAFMQWAALF